MSRRFCETHLTQRNVGEARGGGDANATLIVTSKFEIGNSCNSANEAPGFGIREPNSVSQNADSVKVGAIISDTNHRRNSIVFHISLFLKPLHVLPAVGVIGA